jgi:cytoskeletal protein RodZ
MSVATLEAIENDDPRRLPGGIFSRSFVRSFAVEVGLDPEESLREFERAFPDHAPRPDLVTPESVEPLPSESRRIWPWLLVGALMLGGIGVATFARFGWLPQGGDAAAPTAPAAASPATTAPGPTSAATPAAAPSGSQGASGQSVGTATESGVTAGAGGAPLTASPAVTVPPAGAPLPSATAPLSGAASPSAAMPPPAAGPAPAGALRLVLEPRAECWVELRGDGRVILSRLLKPGERIEAGADEAFQIAVGDAGALGYTINGQAGRSLGRAGQVVRARIDRATLADFLAR